LSRSRIGRDETDGADREHHSGKCDGVKVSSDQKGNGMMERRQFLTGSLGVGLRALSGGRMAAAQAPSTRDLLRQTVGTGERDVGMIAVVVDGGGTELTAYGKSGKRSSFHSV
jgi:hypothetical protein